jgi:uncharacterized membrane protein
MFGLTTLGIFHTAFGLAALICGFIALAQDKQILLKNRLAQVYLVATLLTAATALGIFQHGGFGPPHILALLTLGALAVGTLAATTTLFKGLARYVQAICYSATFLFHVVPGVTESLTRLPPGAPLVASQEAPIFQTIYPVLLVLFLIGLTLQIRWMRARA